MAEITDIDFLRLITFLQKNFGINLQGKKLLVEGRLSNYIKAAGYEDFKSYVDFALNDPTKKELTNVISRLTTNHTFFMREESHLTFLQEKVLPELERTLKQKDIRFWSAGCSSGEEPYAIAMLMQEYFGAAKSQWDTRILATDISSKVLGIATEGIYAADSLKTIPEVWKKKYFSKIDDTSYQISDIIKKEIIFRYFNLMEPAFPFKKKFHVIFCKNVMIYFDQPTKTELLKKYYDLTEPGGYLFVGQAESLNRGDTGYTYIQPSIYRKP